MISQSTSIERGTRSLTVILFIRYVSRMSRKKFFYLIAVSTLLVGVMSSGLISVFFGVEHIRALLLIAFIWTLCGVPAIMSFLLALFTHSTEPFVGSDTSFSSAFIVALGCIGILGLTFHFYYLFFS